MSFDYFILTIFILAYFCFVVLPSKRVVVAFLSSLVLSIILYQVYNKNALVLINWDIINIFIGTLLVSNLIVESGVAEYVAEKVIVKVKNVTFIILLLCAITGFLSMFLENVATLLIVAPIAFQISKKLNITPTKFLFALAISSNLQGSATLIGDPPSMLLAAATNMNFLDFFFYKGKPSIFFAIELGALASFLVLYFIFKKEKQNIEFVFTAKVKSYLPVYLLCFKILTLMILSIFISHNSNFLRVAGFVCVFSGVVALLIKKFVLKTSMLDGIKALDWETAIFLCSIFILVSSIEISGWIEKLGEFLVIIMGKNKFLIYSIFVLFSIIVSGFVDNVPFFATMIPVAKAVSVNSGISLELLLFGLLIGTTLGGNITPVGASANIVAWGLLKKQNYNTNFVDFLKIGLPFTFAAVVPTYFFIWFIWR